MPRKKSAPSLPKIHALRRQRVVLDADLAALYGVPTKQLNQAVKRNAAKFPADFCFSATNEELKNLRSQFVTSSSGHGGARSRPLVFTEHGALMAATVLRSPRAVQMSLYLVRAFVEMREAMLASATILKRLAEIDRRLLEHDAVLREVVENLRPLLEPPPAELKPKIGFHQGNR